TPEGGVALLCGWLCLSVAAWQVTTRCLLLSLKQTLYMTETQNPSSLTLEQTANGDFLIKPELTPKYTRRFVILAGRITVGQKNAFKHWWPHYGLSLSKGALTIDTAFGRQAPVVLEIGFGMGDSLLTMVRREPEKNFIGIEV